MINQNQRKPHITNHLHTWRLTRILKHPRFGKTVVIIHSAAYLIPPRMQVPKRCMSCRQTENTNFCDYENYMNTDNSKYYSLTLTLLGVFLVYFCYEVDLPEFLYFKWLRSIILFLSLPSFLLSLFYIRQSIKKEKINRQIYYFNYNEYLSFLFFSLAYVVFDIIYSLGW